MMSKITDSLMGHALGDALGTPVECLSRDFLQEHKITEMLGGESSQHKEPVGSWSDDTSMELALIDSIINTKTIDYDDIMNNFLLWVEEGKYTPSDHAFGIGRRCLASINSYKSGKKPLECGNTEKDSLSNGSLMRILPVALYSYAKNLSNEEIIELTNNVSSLTHRQEEVQIACYIYVKYVIDLLNGIGKEEAYNNLRKREYTYSNDSINLYSRLIKDDIRDLTIDDINSSSYIVDTIEASFWCLLNNNNYEDTVITAVNLGHDTDTIAAIAGSMAGIIYGINDMPDRWIDKLQKKEYLTSIFNKFEETILKH